uniref:Nucleoprotein n=1 Tax=Corixo rhabdovirus 1 TaxID=3078402 RepID=A0AB38Z2K3_9RHAB
MKQKPKIKLSITEHTREELSNYIASSPQVVTLDILNDFLWKVLSGLSFTLKEEWTSYGIKIGDKDANVNGSALLEVDSTRSETKLAIPETRYRWEFTAILCTFIFRLENVDNEDHRNTLQQRVANLTGQYVEASTINVAGKISEAQANWAAFPLNAEYSKLCAALDMFIHASNVPEYQFLRYGTVATRYKDCSAFRTLGHILDLTGFGIENLCGWMWTRTAADDLGRIIMNHEELSQQTSYFPYQSSMKIVSKSAYSNAVNPSLHYFLHGIGCFLGDARSLNARSLQGGDPTVQFKNAAVVAYSLNTGNIFNLQFVYKGDKIMSAAEDRTRKENLLQSDQPPRTTNFRDWWIYLSTNPKFIESVIISIGNTLRGISVRPQTVGNEIINWADIQLRSLNQPGLKNKSPESTVEVYPARDPPL